MSEVIEGFVDFVNDGDGVGGETLLRCPFQNLTRRAVTEVPYCAAVWAAFRTGESLRHPEPSALAFHQRVAPIHQLRFGHVGKPTVGGRN